MWALPELVEAAARVGDIGIARQALERLAEVTLPAGTEFALRTLARSSAVGRGRRRGGFHREAIDRLTRTQLRPELARAHLLYGESLRRQGRRVEPGSNSGPRMSCSSPSAWKHSRSAPVTSSGQPAKRSAREASRPAMNSPRRS